MKIPCRAVVSFLALSASAGSLLLGADLEKRIAPKPSAKSQWFNCADASFWAQNQPGTSPVEVPDIKIRGDANGLKIYWPGSASAGYVQSSEQLNFERGENGEVRVEFELALEHPEFELLVIPMLKQYDGNGRELGSLKMPEDWLYPLSQGTAPGRFRFIAFKGKPDPNAVTVAPAFEFLGNAVTMQVKSIRLEPVEPKPVWKPTTRGSGSIPDVRYSIDDAVPKEDKPKLTPGEVASVIEKRPLAVPKLEKREGRVQLTINGKEVPFVIHMSPLSGEDAARFGEMADAGFPITTITAKTGPKGDTPGAVGNLWLGEGRYDFEPLKAAIDYVLARAPETYILLHLVINVPNEWGEKHPGDVHANSRGEKGICNWNRVSRYGGPPPSGNEFWEASNFSQQFADDGAAMLSALGKWLNSVPEGKVVIGAYLNGSADGQWLFSDEAEFADYSEGALKTFRKFLKGKYGTNEALSKAWGKDVTFETAEIPPLEDRRRQKGPDPQKGRSPLMEYNGKLAQASDYNAFLSISNTRRQIAFSKGLKDGSGGRLLTGSYWPTLPAPYPLSHTDFTELLDSPYVDFISRGGLMGAVFHGKLTAGELDLRNMESGLDAWLDYDHPFHAKSQGEFRRQLLEAFCRELASGGGFHLWDMWGGWFWHPQTMKIIREGLNITSAIKDPPSLGNNYVGVFIDDEAANYLTKLGQSYSGASVQRTFLNMGWGWASGWERSGLPVRFFTQKDALNPNLVVPKVSIFLNPLTMSLEQAEAIKAKFCRDKHVVVFMLAPGLAAPGTPDNPARITGLKIHEDPATINRALVMEKTQDPLLEGIRPGSMLGAWDDTNDMAWYSNVAGAKGGPGRVLARYAGTNIPGMLVLRKSDYTEVWIGAPGCLSPALLRNMAREAGMTPLMDNGSEVIVGAGLLGVVGTPAGGPQTVKLPKGYVIEKCLTGQKYKVEDGVLTFELGPGDVYGDVAIFSVKGA